MYFRRNVQDELEASIDRKEAVILTGMRRTGKTTLFRHIYDSIPSQNKAWFDFENPIDIKVFEDVDYNDVYRNILQEKNLSEKERVFVFIDEVQQYPEISKIVKYLIDHHTVKFFLTGSASYYLKNLFPESLAGRKRIVELFPLTFGEFLTFKGEDIKAFEKIRSKKMISLLEYEKYDAHYDEFVRWGGFPAVVLEHDPKQKREMIRDIFSSYFQNEILGLAGYRKNTQVRDLLLLLAARVGSKLDIVKISQEIGVARATLYSYIDFLQATYFLHLASPFSRSVDREVSGAKKVYLCDNGILRILAHTNNGQRFENAVYNQLRTQGSMNYYQKRSGAEIDFIVDKRRAYEVKHIASPVDADRLARRAEVLKLDSVSVVSKKFVLSVPNVIFGQFL